MKKYSNYIKIQEYLFEGKIDDIKKKYKDEIPESIIDFFVEESNKEFYKVSSKLIETMVKFYIENKDNKKYDKIQLEKFIFELVKLFQQRKNNLKVKDILKVKSLDELRKLLSSNIDIVDEYDLGLYYDGIEYVIFSPLNFDAAYKYGDHSWCINREPKYFYDSKYKASYGGVIQCINKIDESKNLAVQINNIKDVYNYDVKDAKLDITIYDINDEIIYKGSYDNFKTEPFLSHWCKDHNITAIKEIIGVLDSIEKEGIDVDKYNGEDINTMWEYFNPTFNDAFGYAIERGIVNELLEHIIDNYPEVLEEIKEIFINIDRRKAVDILSSNVNYKNYIDKYRIIIDKNKSPREIWQKICDKMSNEEIVNIIIDEDLLNEYINSFLQEENNYNQLKIFDNFNNKLDNAIEKFISKIDDSTAIKLLNYLQNKIDLDNISYKDFVVLNISNYEDWNLFISMLYYW